MNEGQRAKLKATLRDESMKWSCGFADAPGAVLDVGRNDRGQAIGLEGAERLF